MCSYVTFLFSLSSYVLCRSCLYVLVLRMLSNVTSLFPPKDLHLVDLEDFKYSGSNITGLRLIDPNRDEVKALVDTWLQGRVMATNRLSEGDPVLKVTTQARQGLFRGCLGKG